MVDLTEQTFLNPEVTTQNWSTKGSQAAMTSVFEAIFWAAIRSWRFTKGPWAQKTENDCLEDTQSWRVLVFHDFGTPLCEWTALGFHCREVRALTWGRAYAAECLTSLLSVEHFLISLTTSLVSKYRVADFSSHSVYLVLSNGAEWVIKKGCLNRGLWALQTHANHLLGHHQGISSANILVCNRSSISYNSNRVSDKVDNFGGDRGLVEDKALPITSFAQDFPSSYWERSSCSLYMQNALQCTHARMWLLQSMHEVAASFAVMGGWHATQ